MKITTATKGFQPITIVLTTPAEAYVLRSMIGKTSANGRAEAARDNGYPMSVQESDEFHILYRRIGEVLSGEPS